MTAGCFKIFLSDATACFLIVKIVPTDYDSDGKTDVAVFRPESGNWYQMKSTQGFSALQFGSNGDKPAPHAFVP